MIELKAKFLRLAAAYLYETPLSEDQKIENFDADGFLVTAAVRDTAHLDWWISGSRSAVEIQAPPELRQRMIDPTASLLDAYSDRRIENMELPESATNLQCQLSLISVMLL